MAKFIVALNRAITETAHLEVEAPDTTTAAVRALAEVRRTCNGITFGERRDTLKVDKVSVVCHRREPAAA